MVPFEQLLNSPSADDTASEHDSCNLLFCAISQTTMSFTLTLLCLLLLLLGIKTLESATFLNDEVLKKSLATAEKRIEHLTEVPFEKSY